VSTTTVNAHPAASSTLQRSGFSPMGIDADAAQPTADGVAATRALAPMPRHITIAPGGHRLWAADRLIPRAAALLQGLDCLMEAVAFCSARQVEQLTFLGLPSDHALSPFEGSEGYWLPALMGAMQSALRQLTTLGVRLRLEGSWAGLDTPLLKALLETQARTRNNTGMRLDLRLAQPLALWGADNARQRLRSETPAGGAAGEDGPEADLVIRTGGSSLFNDGRVWDTSSSALYFTNRAWPDFTEIDLRHALQWFGSEGRACGMQIALPADRPRTAAKRDGLS